MPSTTVEIKGKDRSKRAFSSVSRSLKLMKGAVGTLNGAVVGLVSGAVMGAMIKNLADTADKLGKTSSRLGIATDDLQKLQFAAKQSGVEVSTFNMAMQRFTRRVSEAGDGTGVAKDALEELGISVKNQDGTLKSNTYLLKEVANALQATTSQSDRVRLAFKLFDSEGVKMVNMLQKGSGAIERTGEQLESVSGIIDEKAIATFEKFNDRLTIMTSAATGLLSGIVALIVKGFDPFFEEAEKKGLPLTEQLGYLNTKIAELKKELADASISVKTVTTSFFGAKQETEVFVGVNEDLVKSIELEIKVLEDSALALRKKILEQKNSILQTRLQIEEQKRLKVELNDALIIQENFNAKLANQHKLYGQGMAMMDQSSKKLKESNDKKLQDEIDYQDQRIKKNMEASQAHRAMLKQEEEVQKQVALSSLATIQSLSAGVANESRDLFELNKAVSIASVYINAAEASSKALAQLGAFGPPVAGVIYALAIANIAKIGSQEFPGREYGGDVVANQPYIVGEAGPEVFTPGRTGTITPNNKLRGTTNVNFQINTVDASSFDVLLNSRRGMIVNMINQAMHRQGRVGLT